MTTTRSDELKETLAIDARILAAWCMAHEDLLGDLIAKTFSKETATAFHADVQEYRISRYAWLNSITQQAKEETK